MSEVDHTRTVCRYCGEERKNYNSCISHERYCKLNPNRHIMVRTKVICEKCGRKISKSNLTKHLKSHETHPERFEKETYHLDHDDLFCKFCNKECNNKNSLVNHERSCKQNPDYDSNKFKCEFCGRTFSRVSSYKAHLNRCKSNPNIDNIITNYNPWSKGLTKYNNAKLMERSINQSNRIKSGEAIGPFGRKGNNNFSCKPEVRAKISATMKGNHNNNPQVTGRGKKGWYRGIFCSSTYELAFLIYCFDHNIDVKRYDGFYNYSYEGKIRRYYPDFIINDTIIEIKGYYTPQVDAKTSAVTDRPIKVLYRKDLSEVFNYIFDTYGKVVDKNIHELYENMG